MSYFQYQDVDGTVRVVLGTDQGWWLLANNVAWQNITDPAAPLTANDHVQVPVFRTFSKANVAWLLGTNGKDVPKRWHGGLADYEPMGGSPPIARCMFVVFDRVILGNLLSGGTISPVAIDVSANKDFDSGWGSELVALLAETSGHIISMIEMGTQQGAIIKQDALYLLIAQGGTAPFRIEHIKGEISGPSSTALSFKLTDGACGWVGGDGDVSIFDGASVSQLPYAVQKQIISTCNTNRLTVGWTAYDSRRRELYIIYPLMGSSEPNGGVMVNMGTKAVYPIRFPTIRPTAGQFVKTQSGLTIGDLGMLIGQIDQTIGELGGASAIRRLAIGDIGGQTYQDIDTSDNGTPIPVFWQSPVRGTAERFTTIGRIRHRFKRTTVTQSVGFKVVKRTKEPDVVPAKTINIGSTLRTVTGHRISSEYFSMHYSADATQEVDYRGAALYGTSRGNR